MLTFAYLSGLKVLLEGVIVKVYSDNVSQKKIVSTVYHKLLEFISM